MKLAIMQPYIFPYIGYFQAISAVDKYILYGNLTFIKDAWINRNRIALKNGKVFLFTVPLLHKSSNINICDIKIDNTQKWKSKLLKSILLNYKGAAAFDEIYHLIEEILQPTYEYLVDFNNQSIISISNFLNIQTQIECDNTKYIDLELKLDAWEQNNHDVFPELNKTYPIKKVARVIEICKMEKARLFINAIGGKELYDYEEFLKYGIDLKFVQTDVVTYPQFAPEFIPNLSIIDVLMHNGKEGTKQLLKTYTLI